MLQPPVEGYLVAYAIDAIINFCKKYNVEIQTYSVVQMTIALREHGDDEWTPCAPAFRRICIVHQTSTQSNLALVFSYDGVDENLTKELNGAIRKATSNRW